MIKDRFQEFQESVEKYQNGEDSDLDQYFSVIDMEGNFMNDIFYKVNLLENDISELTKLVQLIEPLHDALLAPLSDIQLRYKRDETINYIRQKENTIRRQLNDMKQMQEIKPNARQRIIDIHTNILSKRFCDIMNEYYQSIVTYHERCKVRISRQIELAGREPSNTEVDKLLENEQTICYLRTIEDLQQEQQRLNDMEDRHIALIKIEDDIKDLHCIFVELANLVEDQGIHVSSIEQHVKETLQHTDELIHILPFIVTKKQSWKKMSLLAAFSTGTLPNIQQQLIRYGHSIFLIFGVSGCCLNILLLSRRQFQTSSCCTYFQAMSIISLIHISIAFGFYLFTLDHVDPVGTDTIICKLRSYLLHATGMMYRWCLTIACFDRFALSSVNIRLRNFAQVKIAKRVVFINIIFWSVLTIHIPILISIRFNICSIFSNIIASLYHSVFMSISASVLPISIMITCALLIRQNLALKRQRRQQNTSIRQEVERLQSRRDQQVLIMLFVQMLFYGYTIIPLMIMYFYQTITIYTNKTIDRIVIERFSVFIAEFINFLFPVFSFYLYTLASKMFRVELKNMLYSFIKRRRIENNSRVSPSANEINARALPGQVSSLKPKLQMIKSRSKRIDSVTDVTQKQ
ncbi:hypothetical protein I4U23_020219 [Adineta vaga]|nr:hypothetical protein I4U23_020219 [Adineta vaga]